MKTFPKPLTAEEEREHLKRYREGDQAARDTLIERNLRLVAHIVKKYQNAEDDPEDLISIGTIGLIKAVMTFDEKKGSRLATYAARCIDNELLMMLRTKKKTSRNVSLYESVGTDREGNEIRLLDVIEQTGPEILEKINLKDDILHLYDILDRVLSKREALVVRLRYGLYNKKSLTQREVADMLDISRSYVSRIEKAAL